MAPRIQRRVRSAYAIRRLALRRRVSGRGMRLSSDLG
jgi:hypothetical protein